MQLSLGVIRASPESDLALAQPNREADARTQAAMIGMYVVLFMMFDFVLMEQHPELMNSSGRCIRKLSFMVSGPSAFFPRALR